MLFGYFIIVAFDFIVVCPRRNTPPLSNAPHDFLFRLAILIIHVFNFIVSYRSYDIYCALLFRFPPKGLNVPALLLLLLVLLWLLLGLLLFLIRFRWGYDLCVSHTERNRRNNGHKTVIEQIYLRNIKILNAGNQYDDHNYRIH